MKVRISNNKVRFRLTQPEVNYFHEKGIVTETLAFGNNDEDQLKFSLQTTDSFEINISFSVNHVIVLVPKSMAKEWATTEQAEFKGEVKTATGKTIKVLVEKDFRLIDEREEENKETYSNPLENFIL
jgi:hypothetical protein